MTILQACECCLGAPLVGCVGWALLCVRRRSRPALRYRVGYDALHALPPMPTRPIPPAAYEQHYRTVRGIWQPNPMTDTLVVARPLGWDAQPRKEYER